LIKGIELGCVKNLCYKGLVETYKNKMIGIQSTTKNKK